MEIQVKTFQDAAMAAPVQVSDDVFAVPMNGDLVHQIVTAYRNALRQGAPHRKSRGTVRGSTAKPWRQKGSGRARAGSRKGPIWRGGGVTFAMRTQDYSQKVNRKMYRGAMRCILSERIRTGRMVVIDRIELADHKTKTCKTWLESLGFNHVMIIAHEADRNLILSSGNLPNVWVAEPQDIDPMSLVHFEQCIITTDALRQLEECFA